MCGWTERIPGGTRQDDGQETGIMGLRPRHERGYSARARTCADTRTAMSWKSCEMHEACCHRKTKQKHERGGRGDKHGRQARARVQRFVLFVHWGSSASAGFWERLPAMQATARPGQEPGVKSRVESRGRRGCKASPGQNWVRGGTPSFPSNITREYPPSLLILQGVTILAF